MRADRSMLYVAVSICGKVEVHAHGASSDYATLCGIDSDDSALGHEPAKMPPRAKIECRQCAAIFRECSLLRVSDFSREAGASVRREPSGDLHE